MGSHTALMRRVMVVVVVVVFIVMVLVVIVVVVVVVMKDAVPAPERRDVSVEVVAVHHRLGGGRILKKHYGFMVVISKVGDTCAGLPRKFSKI